MTVRGNDAKILDLIWALAEEAEYQAEGLLWAHSELHLGQFKVLDVIVSLPGYVGIDVVARSLRCSKANVGPMLARLVDDERLECKRLVGRPTRLMFNETEQGFAAWEGCEGEVRRYATSLMSCLTDSEKFKLLALLTKIKEAKKL